MSMQKVKKVLGAAKRKVVALKNTCVRKVTLGFVIYYNKSLKKYAKSYIVLNVAKKGGECNA